MRALRCLFPVIVGAGLIVGCGDDDGQQDLEDALVDTWDVTSFAYTSRTTPSETADPIAQGVDGKITIGIALIYTYVTKEGGGDWELTGRGLMDVVDGDLSVRDDFSTDSVTYSVDLSGSTLTLELIDGTMWYDFDDDGNDEPADARIVMRRTSGLTALDVMGEWVTTSLLYISDPGQTDTVDVLSGGGNITMELWDEGHYEIVYDIPGETTGYESGTYLIDGDELVLISVAFPEDPTYLSFTFSGNMISILGDDDYDFDDDGFKEPATFEATFVKQSDFR